METQCASFEAGTEFLNIIWEIQGKKNTNAQRKWPAVFKYTFQCFNESGSFIYAFPLLAFQDFVMALCHDVTFIGSEWPEVFVREDETRLDTRMLPLSRVVA
jgi:hypothetical protein